MGKSAALRGFGVLVAVALVGLVPVGGTAGRRSPAPRTRPLEMTTFSDAPPSAPLRILFLHHSSGGQLLAEPGPDRDRGGCIYDSHPNGGGLRARLEQAGYEVHEASYGSVVADRTDLFDWSTTFGQHMDRVLRTDQQDATYTDGRRNAIVVFKSCFPNNDFVDGDAPPRALTVANAKAALRELLPRFAAHPEVLFVYMTPPPLGPIVERELLAKVLIKRALGRPSRVQRRTRAGELAREMNAWVVSSDGWLADYPGTNVAVFDYFGLLADPATGLSRFTAAPGDDHPSSEGNRRAAAEFVAFSNRAARRAGLIP